MFSQFAARSWYLALTRIARSPNRALLFLSSGWPMHKPPRTTPQQLIDEHGTVAFGRFADTCARMKGRAADLRPPMGRPASSFARHFHYKQFQYFGIVSGALLIGCAFADTGWLGRAFVYGYDGR